MSESVSTLGSSSVLASGRHRVPKCLIACSGSVATLKVPELVAELSSHFEVMIICTSSAAFFLEKSQLYNEGAWKRFEVAGGWNLVLKDEDEWQMWNAIGNSVLHIEMRRWADILVVAPASANLLSKAAYGIADNFVLSVIRAWDFRKPCVLCPAMNTAMWTHPSTKESLDRLQKWGWEVLGPVEKVLACNEKGNGAMVPVEDIKAYLLAKLASRLTGSTHALTNANLRLHGMLVNSTHSGSTRGEGSPPAASTLDLVNSTHATLDMYKSSGANGDTEAANRAQTGKNTPAQATTVDPQNVHLKAHLASKSASPPRKDQPPAAVAVATTATAASALAAKPAPPVSDTIKPPTSSAVTVIGATTPSASQRVRELVVQSFLLGVGVGVGIVLSNLAVTLLTGTGMGWGGITGGGSGSGANSLNAEVKTSSAGTAMATGTTAGHTLRGVHRASV